MGDGEAEVFLEERRGDESLTAPTLALFLSSLRPLEDRFRCEGDSASFSFRRRPPSAEGLEASMPSG